MGEPNKRKPKQTKQNYRHSAITTSLMVSFNNVKLPRIASKAETAKERKQSKSKESKEKQGKAK